MVKLRLLTGVSALALGLVASYGFVAMEEVTGVDAPTALTADALLVSTTASMFCSDDTGTGCDYGEHRNPEDPMGPWTSYHNTCWPPDGHSGGACTGGEDGQLVMLDFGDVRSATDIELTRMLQSPTNIDLNEAAESVDLYDCTKSKLIGRITLAELGFAVADLE